MFEPVAGVRLHYEMAGEGDQTLIVANVGVLPDFEPLTRGRRVVELHSRGRGASEPIDDPSLLGLRQEADDIVALADHLGIEMFALMGWSYAGFVAALCAAEHPDRVDHLVLVCSMPPYFDAAWPVRAPMAQPEPVAAVERLRASGLEASDPAAYCRAFWRLHRVYRMGDPANAGRIRADACRWENEWPESSGRRMQAMMATLDAIDLRACLDHVAAPTLVVHGDADAIPLPGSEAYAELIPDCRLLRLAGVGHYPHLERPDLFFPAVEDFLRPRAAGGAGPGA